MTLDEVTEAITVRFKEPINPTESRTLLGYLAAHMQGKVTIKIRVTEGEETITKREQTPGYLHEISKEGIQGSLSVHHGKGKKTRRYDFFMHSKKGLYHAMTSNSWLQATRRGEDQESIQGLRENRPGTIELIQEIREKTEKYFAHKEKEKEKTSQDFLRRKTTK